MISKSCQQVVLGILCSIGLSGCLGQHWLVGTWELDKERTVSEISGGTDPDQSEGLIGNLVSGLEGGVARALLTPFEGRTVRFTGSEVIRMQNGSGETIAYELLDGSGPGLALVQEADGKISTWGKVEGGIRLQLSAAPERWVYFREMP
ncbi:MAG: hypothetical protein AAF236_11065 [Verrucomicrobiota bacterium]